MRKCVAILLFLFFTCCVKGQSLTGLYTGTIYNDTTHATQKYELTLNEADGHITGYSHVTFVADDRLYFGVRKVVGIVQEDRLIIEEQQLLENNFPESPAKGVHRTFTLAPVENTLKGSWLTNKTKLFRSVTGTADLAKQKDSIHSSLVERLTALKIIKPPEVAKADIKRIKLKKEPPPPIPYTARKGKQIETIEVKGDSLSLSLYDNGVVDGDIVSVYLNGTPVYDKIMLTERAAKRTIAVPRTGSITLTLVAESLGSIPPNTGLLIVMDGTERHAVYFSTDMETNNTLVIQRKKP